MEILLNKASKCYEPGEKIDGVINFKDHRFTDFE